VAVLVVLLGTVVALLGVLVAGLLRSHAEIIRSLHELGVSLDPDAAPTPPRPPARRAESQRMTRPDREATDLVGETPRGDAISISVVGAPHSTLLAFLTSGCSTCAGFWTAFADADRLSVPGDARLVAVTKGPDGDSPGRLTKFAPPDVPVVMSSAAWDAYDVPVAPYFVYIDGPSGAIVGEGASATWEHLRSMLEQALADAGMDPGHHRRRSTRHHDRVARVDETLRRAGIEPGDPSLYPETAGDLEADHAAPPAERR
jgi:hypothetical protein